MLAALVGAFVALLFGGVQFAGAAGKGGDATAAAPAAAAPAPAGTGKGQGTGGSTGKGGVTAPAPGTTAPAPSSGKGAGSPAPAQPGGGTPGSGGGRPSGKGSPGAHRTPGGSGGTTGGGGGGGTTRKGHSGLVTPAVGPTTPTTQTPPTGQQTPPKKTHSTPKQRHKTLPTQRTHGTSPSPASFVPGTSAFATPSGAGTGAATAPARTPAHTPAVRGHGDGGATGIANAPSFVAREIGKVVRVVPLWAWILVGIMLLLLAASAGATARLARRLRRSDALMGSMRTAALTDPLTGLMNRRGFTDRLERELARARRFGHPLAVAFLDVRGLKAVNDDHGHPAGDAVLRAAAQLVRSSTREEDIVGRIGGDECAVALIEQDRAGAVAFARRIAAAVPSARDELGTVTDWDVTVGVAVFPEDGETGEELLAAADRRLYLRRGIALSATRSTRG